MTQPVACFAIVDLPLMLILLDTFPVILDLRKGGFRGGLGPPHLFEQ